MQANLDLWKEEYRGFIFASEWGRTVCWWDTTWIIMNLIKSDRLSCIKVNINSIDNHHFNNWEEVDLTAPSQLHDKSKCSASLFHLLELIPERMKHALWLLSEPNLLKQHEVKHESPTLHKEGNINLSSWTTDSPPFSLLAYSRQRSKVFGLVNKKFRKISSSYLSQMGSSTLLILKLNPHSMEACSNPCWRSIDPHDKAFCSKVSSGGKTASKINLLRKIMPS